MYSFLADFVVAIHVGYVGYVVVGQLLIWLGLMLGWKWVRNPWFRITHLIAILIVAIEVVFDVRCPLTLWEEHFRVLAGEPITGESFLGRLFHSLLYFNAPEWFFNLLHVGCAMVVLLTFVFFPPRSVRNQRSMVGGQPGT
jgi:hypothetical protein